MGANQGEMVGALPEAHAPCHPELAEGARILRRFVSYRRRAGVPRYVRDDIDEVHQAVRQSVRRKVSACERATPVTQSSPLYDRHRRSP